MRILLGGIPLGCDNIGDEAIVACVVKMLKESISGVQLTVATADPSTAAHLGVNVVPVFGFLDVGFRGFADAVQPAFRTIRTSRLNSSRSRKGRASPRSCGAWEWTTN